jgi:isopentenyl phosphate kinase
MIILKLGGSVITDKTKENTFKQKTMDRLSQEIKRSGKEIIIVHGAGSFGHILAKKHRLNDGYNDEGQLLGFSQTHSMVQKLNTMVLDSLHNQKINAVSLPPHSILKLNNHGLDEMDYDIFKKYLKSGFTPVTFGDVVLDSKLGFSICSGDLLIRALAECFKPEKIVFVMDEDGLYDSNPKTDKNAEFIEKTTIDEFEKLSTKLDGHADVTGGMGGKIETIKNISKMGINTVLLNGNKPDRLYHVLVGEDTRCTHVYGGKK